MIPRRVSEHCCSVLGVELQLSELRRRRVTCLVRREFDPFLERQGLLVVKTRDVAAQALRQLVQAYRLSLTGLAA